MSDTGDDLRLSRRQVLMGTGAALLAGCGGPLTLIKGDYPRYCGDDAGCRAVDAHSHTFNGADLPIDGFVRHVAPVPRALTDGVLGRVTKLLEEQIHHYAPGRSELVRLEDPAAEAYVVGGGIAKKVSKLIREHVPELGGNAYVERIDAVAKIVLSDRRYGAERASTLYPDVRLFVPALVDYDYWSGRSLPKTSTANQILLQAALSRRSMRGQLKDPGVRFHPIVAFNPLKEVREVIDRPDVGVSRYEPFGRADKKPFAEIGAFDPTLAGSAVSDITQAEGSLALVRHAVERLGFVGVKVYPPVGFLPLGNENWSHHAADDLGAKLDLSLRALYAYCEAMDVPVMTHANDSNGYATGYGRLAEPRGWAPVIDAFPRLRLDLGHFGHAEGSDGERGIAACESWARQASELMARPGSRVYADMGNSPFSVYEEERDALRQIFVDLFAREPVVKQRLMYGSDWWMNELHANTALSLTVVVKDLGQCLSDAELRSVMADNALSWLGLSDPTSGNAKRLLTHYEATEGAAALPDWLAQA